MANLEILLLGTPQIKLDGAVIHSFRSNKARALLYFLATVRRPHSRQKLADLLWTALPEERARANLRVELAKLPKEVKPFLQLSRSAVSLNLTIGQRMGQISERPETLESQEQMIDVAYFEDVVCGQHSTLQSLQTAVDSYRGRFLEDFYVQDAAEFEQWSLGEQQRFQQMVLQALFKLTRGYTEQRAYERGIDCANRLLQIEPWREEGHRQLMYLLALNGQRGVALTQYDNCSQILQDELGVLPSDETNSLYDQIESGQISFDGEQRFQHRNGQYRNSQYRNSYSLQQKEIPENHPIDEQHGHRKVEKQQKIGPRQKNLSGKRSDTSSNPHLAQPLGSPTAFHSHSGPLSLAPSRPTYFVGREEATERLMAWLTEGNGPAICAVVGMGGIGKTAFSTHIAYHIQSQFPDGILWADGATSDPFHILCSWAQVYGYDFSGLADIESCAAALRGVLADKKALLILDDAKDVALIRPLLPTSVHCAMLLTTRDLDLAVAIGARPYHLQALSAQDSYQLLCNILGKERVTDEEEAAQTICTLLQKLPLAVEIAAQRLASRRRRKLSDTAQHLRHVQERLNLAMGDRAVRSSFMVSWESLNIPLQRLFAYLAVFEGRSFTIEAVVHMAESDLYTTEDRLFSLVALSLLSEEPNDRYRQHPLLADFAQEQLDKNPQTAQDARIQMATYYQTFAERYTTDYERLRAEWQNLSAGMYTAYLHHRWTLVLNYARSLENAWFVRAQYSDARQAYGWVQDAAYALEDREAVANCLYRWGEACLEQRDYLEANMLLTQSVQIYRELENRSAVADVQYFLAKIALEQGRYTEAEQLFRLCQQEKEICHDQRGVSMALYGQSRLLVLKERYNEAENLCVQALTIQKAIGEQLGLLQSQRLLASIAGRRHEYDIARSYCEASLSLCRELHDYRELAPTLYRLSMICRKQKEFDKAQEYAQESLAMCEQMGDHKQKGLALYALSLIQEELQDYNQAIETGLDSLDLLHKSKNVFGVIHILMHLGDLYKQVGRGQKARQTWLEAMAICNGEQYPSVQKLRKRLGNEIDAEQSKR